MTGRGRAVSTPHWGLCTECERRALIRGGGASRVTTHGRAIRDWCEQGWCAGSGRDGSMGGRVETLDTDMH